MELDYGKFGIKNWRRLQKIPADKQKEDVTELRTGT